MKLKVVPLLLVILLLAGCADTTGGENNATYKQITMSEAVEMMQSESNYIILDVRRPDEFAAGHIPNAVNIPNESIGADEIDELPDKDRLILVYCRSGNRSKQASEKLVRLGYTNIVECGGILDWKGEIEK
ncbi:MAG: rhodanese-like domain-containing protein [Oscillospiraceae bacterium]|nr:rhodanese-like domain-containing protein [Oscillospiraceae bacterium]